MTNQTTHHAAPRRRTITVGDVAYQFFTTIGLAIVATVSGLGFAFASHLMT